MNERKKRRRQGTDAVSRPEDRVFAFLGALASPLGLFFVLAEPQKPLIRACALQSVFLGTVQAVGTVLLIVLAKLVSGIPFLGVVATFTLWTLYLLLFLLLVASRIQLMYAAYQGHVYSLPLVGGIILEKWLFRGDKGERTDAIITDQVAEGPEGDVL